MNINFKKLSKTAVTPTMAHTNDAGFDLYADEDMVIEYGETKAVKTNIAIETPDGFYADIRPRSGLTLKSFLRVHLGTLDAGYRDGIGIICENAGHKNKWLSKFSSKRFASKIETDVVIKKGDKIAQLVFHELPKFTFVEQLELVDSARGLNGFGSTGTSITDEKTRLNALTGTTNLTKLGENL